MGRNLEDQMRLSLRAILSKQMAGGGEKHQMIASFISDDNGFPLTGLKRSEESIVEMKIDEFELICAILPQIWETITPTSESMQIISNKSEVNHLIVGYKKKGNATPPLEMMITRLDELFLSSLYYTIK
ncbi:MAG: hypothetical protein JSU57_03975 [Candidatus Heimdallarchaeota archaeon]|nr:MAG: hypothetical protein JSU57_03975 [Candidatus Heimdallarchaeota archaeon]